MSNWIWRIKNYNSILEENIRLKVIVSLDGQMFLNRCSRKEFVKRMAYLIRCMKEYENFARLGLEEKEKEVVKK